MKKITVDGEYIKLDSFLKYVGEVQTGGQAKFLIKSGKIIVNGEVCQMRGKKLKNSDIVRVNEQEYEVYTDCT